MRIYSGHIDPKVHGMKASYAFEILKKDILRVLDPFLKNKEYINLRIFGSIVSGEDTEDSDIDILLSIGPAHHQKSDYNLYSSMINTIKFPIDIVIEDFLPSYIDISQAVPFK